MFLDTLKPSDLKLEDIVRRVRLPERLRQYLPTVEIAKVGSHLGFAGAPFADPVDKAELMHRFIMHNPDATPDLIKATGKRIDHSGIRVRHVSPPLSAEYTMETVLDEAAAIGAFLTLLVMSQNGWQNIDWFKLASATLPNGMSERVLDRANLIGVRAFDDRIACAGGLTSYIDAVTNPDLRNSQGVVLTLEPLTHLQGLRHYQDQLAIAMIFGNNHVAMSVATAKVRPIAWRIRVIPDGGVIQVKKEYQVVPNGHLSPPEHLHLEFAEGGERITEVSEKGLLIDLNQPDEPDLKAKMDNQGVADFFTKVFPPTVLDNFEEEPEEYADEPIEVVVFHDPTKFVSYGVGRGIRDGSKLRSERIQKRVSGLPPHGFLLAQMDRANSSSSTLIQKLLFLARQGQLPPRGLWVLGAMGIGSGNAVIELEWTD